MLPAGQPKFRRRKADRPDEIVAAALEIFSEKGFAAARLDDIAVRAGVSKGAIYLYFATKETLFLELVRAELTQWLADLTLKLKRLRSTQPASAVPTAVARSLAERPALRRLLVLLHTVIEPNIDEASARDFKRFLRDLLAEAGAAMADKIPGLSVAKAVTFVLQTHALVISITQLADPPPVIARVIAADASLQSMCIDFESFLADTLRTLVRGMLKTV